MTSLEGGMTALGGSKRAGARSSKSGENDAAPAWPRLTYESREWRSTEAAFGAGATRLARERTYEVDVVPHVVSLSPEPNGAARELAAEASTELTRFDAELGSSIAAFAPVLLRSEAAASSQIENLTASARAIFTAELGAKTGGNAIQIAANTRAMQAAIELADHITPDSILRMHKVLMEGQDRHAPGMWRTEPVWIGTSATSPVGATFVPPDEDRVPTLIRDLVDFTHREDVPALIQVAVAHAQFETIHPFTDGNGRTGRALAQSMLRHRGVTRNVAVPVSAGLLSNV